jgi:GNAT superfamily N-acetyltransferase
VRLKNLGFITDLVLRSLEGASVSEAGDHLVIRSPDNPAFWWGNFILLAEPPAPGSADHWLATFAAAFPEAQHVTFGVDSTAAVTEIPADFAEAGLIADRMMVLTATEVREPARPSTDTEIRPLRSDEDWEQSLDLTNRGYEDGAGEPEFARRRTAARRRTVEEGHGTWLGAFEDGRLLSQLGLFGITDDVARYQDVVTDPAARRRGLASTLLWQAGRHGRETLGASTLVIVADPAESAINLYRTVGFKDTQTQLSLIRQPEGSIEPRNPGEHRPAARLQRGRSGPCGNSGGP